MIYALLALENIHEYCSNISSEDELSQDRKTVSAIYGELVLLSKSLAFEMDLDYEEFKSFTEDVDNGIDFINGFNVGLIWSILKGKKIKFIKDILLMYLETKINSEKEIQRLKQILESPIKNKIEGSVLG